MPSLELLLTPTPIFQAKAVATCLSTTKCLYDLQAKYKNAPMIIVSICSELHLLSASLAKVESLLLHHRHNLVEVWQSRTDLPALLDAALAGCTMVFSSLDTQVQRITDAGKNPGWIQWRPRLRTLWNEQQLNDLLGGLRGQQGALNLLIQLLQT